MSDQVGRNGSSSAITTLVDLTNDELEANKDKTVIEITESDSLATPSANKVEDSSSQNGGQTGPRDINASPMEAVIQTSKTPTSAAIKLEFSMDRSLPALVPESQSSLPPARRPTSDSKNDDKAARIIFKRPRLIFDSDEKSDLKLVTVSEDNLSLRHFRGISYYFDRETRAVFLDHNVQEHSIMLSLEKDHDEPTPCQLEWLLRATTLWELNLPVPPPPTSETAKAYFNGRGNLLACAEEVNISKLASGVTLAEKLTAARNASYLSVQEKQEMFDSWVTRPTKLSSTLLPNPLIQRSNTIASGSTVTVTKHQSNKTFSPPEWGSSTEPCKCRKSHCLKKYCLCFSKGEHCSLRCNCRDCLNVSKHRRSEAWLAAVLAAHGPTGKPEPTANAHGINGGGAGPSATIPASPGNILTPATAATTRTIGRSESLMSAPATAPPASAGPSTIIPGTPITIQQPRTFVPPQIPVAETAKTSCRCKESRCMKKYCECLASGSRCSYGCQCLNCLNI